MHGADVVMWLGLRAEILTVALPRLWCPWLWVSRTGVMHGCLRGAFREGVAPACSTSASVRLRGKGVGGLCDSQDTLHRRKMQPEGYPVTRLDNRLV